MSVDHLKVLFPIKAGLIIDRTIAHVHAVDDVTFTIVEGETLGVVGESGCGKTTLIRALVRLVDSTGGAIHFRETDITEASRRTLQPIRREMQMVFQDPQASLNPRKRITPDPRHAARAARGAAGTRSRRRAGGCCPAAGRPAA